jgi:hypothetical protein
VWHRWLNSPRVAGAPTGFANPVGAPATRGEFGHLYAQTLLALQLPAMLQHPLQGTSRQLVGSNSVVDSTDVTIGTTGALPSVVVVDTWLGAGSAVNGSPHECVDVWCLDLCFDHVCYCDMAGLPS